MRFMLTPFTRVKPAAPPLVTLGSDTIPGYPPTAQPYVAQRPPNQSQDNVLFCAFDNVNGWPLTRIAVACTGPAAANIAGDGYIWEDQTASWQKVNAAPVTITPGTLAYFDVPTTFGAATRGGGVQQPGSLAFMLVITDAGATPNGTYVFTMTGDTTTKSI